MIHDIRKATRKQISYPAKVILQDGCKLDGQTIDLSLGGVAILLPEQIRPGQYCAVMFTVRLKDADRKIRVVGQIIYSVSNSTDGFNTGLQFLDVDPESTQAISELLSQ